MSLASTQISFENEITGAHKKGESFFRGSRPGSRRAPSAPQPQIAAAHFEEGKSF